MENTNLPPNYENVMITYIKSFRTGAYGDTIIKQEVTRMGFYCKLFDHFAIPPSWQTFNGVLLPHGFGGDRLKAEEVIKWEEVKI